MQLLLKLYDKALVWSQHKHAPRYLAMVSFIEASVFPIPPYFMLAPMALAKPSQALRYALIATIASVFGGLIGYMLGYYLFDPLVLPLLEYFNCTEAYFNVSASMQARGFGAVLLAGFTPVPFKLIAIGAGVLHIPVHEFFLASILGRGLKFFAVAALIKFGGVGMEQVIRQSIAKLGLVFSFIIISLFGLIFFGVI